MAKKLTIAIPAYNNEKTIEDAIKSAKKQRYDSKRIIVFDDNSTDKTRTIARRLGVTVYKNKKNLGIGKNLERIFNSVRSNYLLLLCADDIFASPYVAGDVTRVFAKFPSIGVISRFYYQFMDGNPNTPVMCIREPNFFYFLVSQR